MGRVRTHSTSDTALRGRLLRVESHSGVALERCRWNDIVFIDGTAVEIDPRQGESSGSQAVELGLIDSRIQR